MLKYVLAVVRDQRVFSIGIIITIVVADATAAGVIVLIKHLPV